MISDISTRSRRPCNPSTTRSARGCHPYLRYSSLPMCPGRTTSSKWRRERNLKKNCCLALCQVLSQGGEDLALLYGSGSLGIGNTTDQGWYSLVCRVAKRPLVRDVAGPAWRIARGGQDGTSGLRSRHRLPQRREGLPAAYSTIGLDYALKLASTGP